MVLIEASLHLGFAVHLAPHLAKSQACTIWIFRDVHEMHGDLQKLGASRDPHNDRYARIIAFQIRECCAAVQLLSHAEAVPFEGHRVLPSDHRFSNRHD